MCKRSIRGRCRVELGGDAPVCEVKGPFLFKLKRLELGKYVLLLSGNI